MEIATHVINKWSQAYLAEKFIATKTTEPRNPGYFLGATHCDRFLFWLALNLIRIWKKYRRCLKKKEIKDEKKINQINNTLEMKLKNGQIVSIIKRLWRRSLQQRQKHSNESQYVTLAHTPTLDRTQKCGISREKKVFAIAMGHPNEFFNKNKFSFNKTFLFWWKQSIRNSVV